MNLESVGKKFKGKCGIYECIAFSEKPSIIMKNLDTGEKISFTIDSLLAKDFEEIIEEEKKIDNIARIERKPKNIDNVYLKNKLNEIIDYLKSKGE